MITPIQRYYDKRGEVLVKNLQSRHFDAYYCQTKEEALAKALELIPQGASVGWGGAMSAEQIGLIDAVKNGDFKAIDRSAAKTQQERTELEKACMFCDVFLTGANGLSLDGQMVNIDGTGNRVAATIYGPEKVLVIAGMNKVEDDLEAAVRRARTVAAPMNQQRFMKKNPCSVTGSCADCKSESCICNQIVITRHCRPTGRIVFILVGETLGL
ncbi:MAG: lactate utilization protein [Oscillospiraceae bacterium]|nr:lactate utilization protein [Oscillospiraceae bacterium]